MKKFRRMTRSNQFKIVLLVIAVAFLIWLLTSIVPYKAEMFSVKITVNCDNVCEVWCNSFLGGKDRGTTFVENVGPEAPIPIGEVISFDFPAALFENTQQLRLSKFGFSLTVIDMDCKEHEVHCEGASFTAYLGKEYLYTLTYENGEYRCAPT